MPGWERRANSRSASAWEEVWRNSHGVLQSCHAARYGGLMQERLIEGTRLGSRFHTHVVQMVSWSVPVQFENRLEQVTSRIWTVLLSNSTHRTFSDIRGSANICGTTDRASTASQWSRSIQDGVSCRVHDDVHFGERCSSSLFAALSQRDPVP